MATHTSSPTLIIYRFSRSFSWLSWQNWTVAMLIMSTYQLPTGYELKITFFWKTRFHEFLQGYQRKVLQLLPERSVDWRNFGQDCPFGRNSSCSWYEMDSTGLRWRAQDWCDDWGDGSYHSVTPMSLNSLICSMYSIHIYGHGNPGCKPCSTYNIYGVLLLFITSQRVFDIRPNLRSSVHIYISRLT